MKRSRWGLSYVLVRVVGVTVLAVSSYYLWKLAVQVHMPQQLAWTLPVALDAGAAGATHCWLSASGAARVWGRRIALGALAGTVGGNALSHLIEANLLVVTPLLVIAIGAVYPATLWAMVHLELAMRPGEASSVSEPVADVSPMDQEAVVEASGVIIEPVGDASVMPHEPVVDASVVPQGPVVDASAPGEPAVEASLGRKGRRSTPEGRRRWIAAQLDAGREVSGGDVERRFSTRNGAREVAQVVAARSESAVGVAS